MKLKKVYARFYKSFNFDHLRKAHPDAKEKLWESFRGNWYPYIEVPIDQDITTIVGANESGKSHLLSAIKKAITGKGFKQLDLCRYSPFFNVEQGQECWPHLGVEWSHIAPGDAEILRKSLAGGPASFDALLMFRETPSSLAVYLPDGSGGFYSEKLEGDAALAFGKDVLPQPFEIQPDVALPNSIPLAWLLDPTSINSALTSRRMRSTLIESIAVVATSWASNPTQFAQHAPTFYTNLDPFFGANGKLGHPDEKTPEESLKLARSLLLRLADIDLGRLKDLSGAIADGEDGHANALVTRINDQLAKKLNFPKWWVQDRNFSLRVTPREMDLVFTVSDRTGTEYTFSERSSGLKYFLSYLIQSQARDRSQKHPEILLMDEPDTYLSAEAQQDLLKIFDDFAKPETDVAPIQVVFVTHSPFLIDKNHADRIRVLEKSKGLDGTRVIRNASQNHYEPLRSAFGSFVGETAFIGACNLLVEGVADQVLLSGAARLIRRDEAAVSNDTLDLNRLVIVPCGSASQVPYMLYLIRGRDADKPPVIALLDSDAAGTAAANLMRKDDKKMRRLIDKQYVVQLGEIAFMDLAAANVFELEDLIPPNLAVAAANTFLRELNHYSEGQQLQLTIEDVTAKLADHQIFGAVNAAAGVHGFHIEKLGFARAVIDICKTPETEHLAEASSLFLARMRQLFKELNVQRRQAERESTRERVGTRVDQQQIIFLRDHPAQATKEQALLCLENIEHVLDDTAEADAVRTKLAGLKRTFQLDDDLRETVPNYPSFAEGVRALKHEFAILQLDPTA